MYLCGVFVVSDSDSTLTIRIPSELKQAAESVARSADTTISQQVRAFLREYVVMNSQKSLLGDDVIRTKSRPRKRP
jgi:hypothetical protein